jgi:hypothetical protein
MYFNSRKILHACHHQLIQIVGNAVKLEVSKIANPFMEWALEMSF